MEKKATGWVPDYPDIKDYTLASKAVRSALSQVQGTQVAGTLESQKENILQLLKLIEGKPGTENKIQEIKTKIDQVMSNEVNLVKVQLVQDETSQGSKDKEAIGFFDIDRIPTQVFQSIVEKMLPYSTSVYLKEKDNLTYQTLNTLIYPIVKIVSQILSPITEKSNIEKAVLDKGIRYFTSLISANEIEDRKNYSLSDYQTMLRWKFENEFFKHLAASAILDVKLTLIEEQGGENLEGVNRADEDEKKIYKEVEDELKVYFDKVLKPKDLPFQKVLEFDGENNYLYVENFEWEPDQPVTVEFWAKVNKADMRDRYAFTVGAKTDPDYFSVTLPWGNGRLYWEYGAYEKWGALDVDYRNYLNEWTHVALVSQGKDGKFMGIYLNGTLEAHREISDAPKVTLKKLWIGKFEQNLYKGKIAEFRIWNQVRTQEKLQKNMYQPLTGTEDGLVGYWAFDEGNGNEVADKTKFNNSGLLNGNPKPKWKDFNKNVVKWLYTEEFSQIPVSAQQTKFKIMDSQVIQEESITEGSEIQSLQFPILNKYLDKIQQTTNSGENSNEGDGSVGLTNLPKFVDLSFWCSPVEDQGSLNSCTANAAVGLMEYFQKKSFGKYIDGSRLFLYKATRNLMQIEGNVGTSIRNTMKAMALFGVPPEEYWPYQEDKVNDEPISFCYAFAQNYQALKYFRLDAAGIREELLLAQIKAILVAGIPCVFGFTLYHSIYDESNPRGHIPFPHKRDKAEGGHAVVAVGYDDYKQIKNADGNKSTGALLIRNCWGTKWGEGGYGWLPYDYVLKGLTADWWSLLNSEWFDTEQFGLGGKDWTDNVGKPEGQGQ